MLTGKNLYFKPRADVNIQQLLVEDSIDASKFNSGLIITDFFLLLTSELRNHTSKTDRNDLDLQFKLSQECYVI